MKSSSIASKTKRQPRNARPAITPFDGEFQRRQDGKTTEASSVRQSHDDVHASMESEFPFKRKSSYR